MNINRFMGTVVFNKTVTIAALKRSAVNFLWIFMIVGGIFFIGYYRNSAFENLIEQIMFFLVFGISLFFALFVLNYFFTFLCLLRTKSFEEFLELDDIQKSERLTSWFY